MNLACVFGCGGLRLTEEEVAFYRDVRPWGFILFRRNVETPDQVRALTESLRRSVDRPDAPVMVDQEGGRVQRLAAPHWRRYPPARAYGALAAPAWERRDLARLAGRLMAHDLEAVGIDVVCAPVADTPVPGAHDVIGDRAFSEDAAQVGVLARAMAEGLIAGRVLPVVKHTPGHGRAGVDSHQALPVVSASLAELERTDFAPFRALSDMPMAMTAHVVYAAVDPLSPATTSRAVLSRIVRGTIGFSGLLLSDDLSMKALRGDLRERASDALAAGCDIVLHCDGDLAGMTSVAAGARELDRDAGARANVALARRPTWAEPLDVQAARARLDSVMPEAVAS